jgi:Flp pilus assembly protein TadD
LALARDRTLRSAFSGLAESCTAARKYDEAARHLRDLLQLEPKDARAWLNLGDVQMWRGDEVSARASYENAATTDPNAADVIARAKLRLDNMDLVRRRVGRLVQSAEPVSP